jgi:rfaE bifunctional protein nucleotidyltransferase chain/domain
MTKFEVITSKIIAPENLNRTLAVWRFKNEKIVFTNGCFDIIHRGHVEYLAKAAQKGSKFIVGLNTDASVKRLKGPSRPINDEFARALVLASFSFIDAIVFFDEETPYNLIKVVQPDVLIKGGDYKIQDIVGYDIVTQKGGIVETIDFVDGFSSSSIIKKGNLA